LCIPVEANFLCGRQTSNKNEQNRFSTFGRLPLPAYLLLASFYEPREALAVLEAVGAADTVRGEDKVMAIEAAVFVTVTPILAQQTRQQESTAPARNGPRQERHQNDPSNAHLSNNSVYLTTQAW
jgi:hypothetical protein